MGSLARKARRASQLRRREDDPWKWEDRSHLRDHPEAPMGLRAAYVSRYYSVQVFDHRADDGLMMTHLMVRRHDDKPIRSWADMQRIKDHLCGRERVAVEVYPPASEVVDQANIYHLWVFPEGVRLPFRLGD